MALFRPRNADAATVSAVTGLSEAQVAALARPFAAGEKPTEIATLQTFEVSCDLSGVVLPKAWLTRVWVYVLSSNRATYAPLSHYPLPPPLPPPKSTLFRLFGGQTQNGDVVSVSLPEPLKLARIAVEVRGIYTPLPPPSVSPTPIPPPIATGGGGVQT